MKMPAPEGEPKIYITGIKEDCPMEGITLLGVQFQKTVYPSEKGYIQNQDKTYIPQLIARTFTDNQFKAIMQRAKEVKYIVTVSNPEFDNEKKIDKENVKWIQKEILASENIILIPADEYKHVEIRMPNKIEEKNIFDEAEKTVYDIQKDKKKK